jgi:hypothetical protein
MSNDLIIDHDTFKDAADALQIINPVSTNMYQWMWDTALRQEPGYLGYLSTGGFELCFWQDEQGQRHVRASVMAYTVKQWLGKQSKKEG